MNICARIGCDKEISAHLTRKVCSDTCKSTYYRQLKIIKEILESIATGDYSKLNYNVVIMKTLGFKITEMKPI